MRSSLLNYPFDLLFIRRHEPLTGHIFHHPHTARPALQRIPDGQQASLTLFSPLAIPETQRFDVLLRQKFFAHGIALQPLRQTVLGTVQFHRQPRRRTIEIQNVITHRMLPAKFETRKPLAAQRPPQIPFRVRLVTAKLAGSLDPSVFSTEYNREGIRVGTTIGLLVRKPKRSKKPQVFFRQFWGADKRAKILESLQAKKFAKQYESVEPTKENRFLMLPSTVSKEYLHWPAVVELSQCHPFNGPIERRGNSLIVFEENKKELAKLADYFDPKISDEEIRALVPEFMKSAGEFDAKKARSGLKGVVDYKPQAIARYPFKPFDIRAAYLDADIQPLFSRPSPELLQQRFKGNNFFITRDTADKDIEGSPFYFSPLVCDYDCISGHARHFPIRLQATPKTNGKKKNDGNGELGNILHEAAPAYNAGKITANLSPAARAYLAKLGIKNPDDDEDTAALIWMHALAIGYSPAYLTENADGVQQDWPRIPLPDSKAALLASAEFGRQVAALLDTENGVEGVTAGKLKQEFKEIAVLSSTKNLSLTAGWGHKNNGATMPGQGKFATKILDVGPDYKLPWFEFHDVYLNEAACWKDIPAPVWDYTIGGYQVIKKWLSYREFDLLGRALTPDEAREVTHMARRIAALILLQPELDRNYRAVKAAAVAL